MQEDSVVELNKIIFPDLGRWEKGKNYQEHRVRVLKCNGCCDLLQLREGGEWDPVAVAAAWSEMGSIVERWN